MDSRFVDFNKYHDPKDVKNYELFIGPSGEYYKVKTTYESADNCTHYKWAEYYLDKYAPNIMHNEKVLSICKTPLEVLINLYGFIRYTHTGDNKPYFTFPNVAFGYQISKDQKEALYKLMDYNNEKITTEIVEMIENGNDGHNNASSITYRRML